MPRPVHVLILLGLCLAVYWPHRTAGFVLDDHYVIAHNPAIKSPARWKDAFTQELFHAYKSTWSSELKYYRPVLTMSYALDYQLWGLDAFGYRMLNLLIHWGNSCLVYYFILLLFRHHGLAFLGAVIFDLLPAHEWVVAYIVGRGDLLQTGFSVLSLIFLVKAGTGAGRRWLALSGLIFLLAILSREASVLLPAYALLIVVFQGADLRQALRRIMPHVVIAAGYLVLRQLIFPISNESAGRFLDPSFWGEWLAVSGAYWWRFFVPWTVYVDLPAVFHHDFVTIAAALASIAAVALMLRRNVFGPMQPPVKLGLAWLLLSQIAYIPVLPMFEKLGPYAAEHFLYFPAIGAALLLASLLHTMRAPRLRQLICLGLTAYFLLIGVVNRFAWTSEQAILAKAAALDPDPDSLAAQQLAMRYVSDQERIRHFIATAPDAVKRSIWLKRLGNVHHLNGDYGSAIAALRQALEANPNNLDALNELAVCFMEQGRWDAGFAALFESLNRDPAYYDTNRLTGIAFYYRGQFDKAVMFLEKAHDYAPENEEIVAFLTKARRQVSR